MENEMKEPDAPTNPTPLDDPSLEQHPDPQEGDPIAPTGSAHPELEDEDDEEEDEDADTSEEGGE